MIRWTDEAIADLTGQIAWLHERNPSVAAHIGESLLQAVERLGVFPSSGRVGRRPGTRELVATPLPYVIVYTVVEAGVVILRVLHGAQGWPP